MNNYELRYYTLINNVIKIILLHTNKNIETEYIKYIEEIDNFLKLNRRKLSDIDNKIEGIKDYNFSYLFRYLIGPLHLTVKEKNNIYTELYKYYVHWKNIYP